MTCCVLGVGPLLYQDKGGCDDVADDDCASVCGDSVFRYGEYAIRPEDEGGLVGECK